MVEGSVRLTIPFDASDAVHAQFVNEMFVCEREDEDEGTSMVMNGKEETERVSIPTSDMFTVPFDIDIRVEDNVMEEEEEEEVKVREESVSVAEVVLVTNTPSRETLTDMVEMVTSDDPLIVKASVVSETFVVVTALPVMEIALLSVEVTSAVSYDPAFI